MSNARAAGHLEDALAKPEGFGLESLDGLLARSGGVFVCHGVWSSDEVLLRAESTDASAWATKTIISPEGPASTDGGAAGAGEHRVAHR